MREIMLAKQEYGHFEDNGKRITVCTLRQKVLHTSGLRMYGGNQGRLYTRHGKIWMVLLRRDIWIWIQERCMEYRIIVLIGSIEKDLIG